MKNAHFGGICIFSLFLIAPNLPCDHRLFVYLKKPQVKAFLDVISYAEGTLQADGYHMRYPNTFFTSFRDHPRTKLCGPFKDRELCSTAAGRYMILAKTWDKIAPQIGAYDFSPRNQDKAAFALIVERGALPHILHHRIKKAILALNKVWATFPGAPYDNPTKTMNELIKVYHERLAYHTNN